MSKKIMIMMIMMMKKTHLFPPQTIETAKKKTIIRQIANEYKLCELMLNTVKHF